MLKLWGSPRLRDLLPGTKESAWGATDLIEIDSLWRVALARFELVARTSNFARPAASDFATLSGPGPLSRTLIPRMALPLLSSTVATIFVRRIRYS